jgi:hypothetical protein
MSISNQPYEIIDFQAILHSLFMITGFHVLFCDSLDGKLNYICAGFVKKYYGDEN